MSNYPPRPPPDGGGDGGYGYPTPPPSSAGGEVPSQYQVPPQQQQPNNYGNPPQQSLVYHQQEQQQQVPNASAGGQQQQLPPQQQQHQPQYQHQVPPGVYTSPQQQHPVQLTQAQLSPAVGPPAPNPTAEQQQAGAAATASATVDAVEKKLKGTLTSLFKSDSNVDGRNVGFTPTDKMAALHDKHVRGGGGGPSLPAVGNNSGPKFLHQFQVTKLRTWRTGYERLLALCDDGTFATLDPTGETPTETNRWKYAALSEWLALPKEKDTILLQVEKDKLKFSCHNVHRALVLTALLQCQDESGQAPAQETIVFAHVQRQTRHGTLVNVSLHVKAYGIVEVNPETKERIRTYRYTDMRACSFTQPKNDTGLVFYLDPIAVGKSRLYFIHSSRQGGNGRSDILTLMRENCEVLGVELPMEESITAPEWIARRRNLDIGTVATSWQVSKTTRRHDVRYVGSSYGVVGGIVTRQLSLTGRGFLVERDGNGVVSCWRMADLYAVVRHSHSGEFTLEFTNGSIRTYTCNSRDALIVSILDASMTLAKNQTIHVTDVLSAGYCLESFASVGSASESGSAPASAPSGAVAVASSLFHPTFIPRYCLRRVHALATQAYAFISREFEHFQPGQPIQLVEECKLLVEACREFNASVLPTGDGLPTSSSDKQISGSIGALWGLVTKLLERPTQQGDDSVHNARDVARAENTCSAFFQTLYRLSKTPAGYKISADLSTMQESIPLLFRIDDVFCKFWAFQVMKVLLSGLPDRDKEAEYVNKSVIFRAGGQNLVDGFVIALLEPTTKLSSDGKERVSDMVLMVASDVLQSILCSFHDTTTPEYFSAFISALAERFVTLSMPYSLLMSLMTSNIFSCSSRYRALLSTLRSQAPCIIENTALLIHLLSTHAPATASAIRDAALSSAILLHHFYAAIFSPMEGQRFLSRYLCSLWLSGPMNCDEKRLLKRMVPHGFLAYLAMPALSPVEEEQLDELEHDAAEENIRDVVRQESSDSNGSRAIVSASVAAQQGAAGTNTARLRTRIALATATSRKNSQAGGEENFRIFFHVLTQNHSLPDLIWSQQTRRELRIALESEIQYIKREVEARGVDSIAWNHQQFRVKFPSLDNEVKVGNVYMRLWLQAGDGFIKSWDDPVHLFELLFRRLLCEIDRDIKVRHSRLFCVRSCFAFSKCS